MSKKEFLGEKYVEEQEDTELEQKMATGLLQQKLFKHLWNCANSIYFGFLLVALAVVMEDRISSAKKRITGKRSFSEGNRLAYVPISELSSTYLHSMWVLRLCQRSCELRMPSLCQKRGSHEAFWRSSAFPLNKRRKDSLFPDRLVLVSLINSCKNFAVVPKMVLLNVLRIK